MNNPRGITPQDQAREVLLLRQQIAYLTGCPSPQATINDYRADELDQALLMIREAGLDRAAEIVGKFRLFFRMERDERISAQARAAEARDAALEQAANWQPIETAPKDGRYILAVVGDGCGERFAHLRGRVFAIRHEGRTSSGFDLGWALHPGFGGVSSHWFDGWMVLPAAALKSPPQHTGGGDG